MSLDASTSYPSIDVPQSVQATTAQAGTAVNIIPGDQKHVDTKYRSRNHQMVFSYWSPDYVDPHSNADTFARNPDNSDNAKSKPLAWRNGWEIPELTKKTDARCASATRPSGCRCTSSRRRSCRRTARSSSRSSPGTSRSGAPT